MDSNVEVLELLRSTRISVAPETFALVSLSHSDWRKMLEIPDASPRMTAPFMILVDKDEVTLMLDEIDFAAALPAHTRGKVEREYRLLTFDIELDFTVVGFFAEISRILAEARIPIMALSAFSRDHLLIKEQDLEKALEALGEHVKELC